MTIVNFFWMRWWCLFYTRPTHWVNLSLVIVIAHCNNSPEVHTSLKPEALSGLNIVCSCSLMLHREWKYSKYQCYCPWINTNGEQTHNLPHSWRVRRPWHHHDITMSSPSRCPVGWVNIYIYVAILTQNWYCVWWWGKGRWYHGQIHCIR